MSVVNLTRHDIQIVRDGHIITIPASGQVARLAVRDTPTKNITGIPGIRVVNAQITEPVGLPEPDGESTYILSSLMALKLASKRPDLLSPLRPFYYEPLGGTACRGLKRYV